MAAAAAGKGPDIMCWAHDRVGEWAKSGLIVPIRPIKRIRDEIEDSTWQALPSTMRAFRIWWFLYFAASSPVALTKPTVPRSGNSVPLATASSPPVMFSVCFLSWRGTSQK